MRSAFAVEVVGFRAVIASRLRESSMFWTVRESGTPLLPSQRPVWGLLGGVPGGV